MKNKLKFIVAGLLLANSVAFAGPPNLVTNGSFEDFSNLPLSQAGGTWGQFVTLNGWQSFGGDSFEIQLATDFQSNLATGIYPSFNPSSSDGSAHYLEINANRLGDVGQTLQTVVGQSYKVSFDYSGRSDSGTANNSKAEVFWGGQLIATLNQEPNSGWQTYGYTLTASNTKTLLEFRSIGPTAKPSYGSYLDAVSVTAVPEPESYAMMLAGLGLLGFMARRKKTA